MRRNRSGARGGGGGELEEGREEEERGKTWVLTPWFALVELPQCGGSFTTVRNMEAGPDEELGSTRLPFVLDAAAFEHTPQKQGAQLAARCRGSKHASEWGHTTPYI